MGILMHENKKIHFVKLSDSSIGDSIEESQVQKKRRTFEDKVLGMNY